MPMTCAGWVPSGPSTVTASAASTTCAAVATSEGLSRKPVPIPPPSQVVAKMRNTPDSTVVYVSEKSRSAVVEVGTEEGGVSSGVVRTVAGVCRGCPACALCCAALLESLVRWSIHQVVPTTVPATKRTSAVAIATQMAVRRRGG